MFTFAFAPRYLLLARLFRVTPDTTGITVTSERLVVRFGPWRVDTTVANIDQVAITGPYALWKTAGPARLGLTDRGLTFATNSRAGVFIEFREPVRGIDPAGLIRHPNLTVTPDDVTGLAASLAHPSGS